MNQMESGGEGVFVGESPGGKERSDRRIGRKHVD